VSLAATATIAAILLQGGTSDASTVRVQPSLSSLVAEAAKLSNEVDSLGQQYDGLKIQMSHAQTEERLAKLAAARAAKALSGSQQAVAQLAAMGYMNQGLDPTLQMLTNGDPQRFLNQASVVQELDNQAGERLSTLQQTQQASARAQVTAREEIATVDQLQTAINGKVAAIHAKLNVLNSAAMTQAMAIFQKTGTYPNIVLPDCSGLVVWAFAQEGISLPHYTGSLWNSGMHVSRADLEPGDLVFFFADISHVGIFIGNGLMVDAPSSGQLVQVQPIYWNAYVGAVRIA